jgi:hypothetical protein
MAENNKMSKVIIHYGGSAAIPGHSPSAGIPRIRYSHPSFSSTINDTFSTDDFSTVIDIHSLPNCAIIQHIHCKNWMHILSLSRACARSA